MLASSKGLNGVIPVSYMKQRSSFTMNDFLCVCPEPVLVKRSYIAAIQKGEKNRLFSHHREGRALRRGAIKGVVAAARAEPMRALHKTCFFSTSLCLSRACLGKKIVFSMNWRKKRRFCT
eukprot:COSAG06_NODE_6284_length_2998_cov_5.244430_2_plen_120_part_00